jgi:hypothetical protein
MSESQYATQITVKLTNAIDQALIFRELLSPKSLRSCEVEAILDPSLIYLTLPEQVARQLGLRRVHSAIPQAHELPLTEPLRLEWNGQMITEDALIMGDQVRLGRVVLEKLDLLVSCRERMAEQAANTIHSNTAPDAANPDFSRLSL